MFQLANHLVGIYKTNNRTKNVILSSELLKRFQEEDRRQEKDAQQLLIQKQKIAQSKATNVDAGKDMDKAFDDLLAKTDVENASSNKEGNIQNNEFQKDQSPEPSHSSNANESFVINKQTEGCENDSFDALLLKSCLKSKNENKSNTNQQTEVRTNDDSFGNSTKSITNCNKAQDSGSIDVSFNNLLTAKSAKKVDKCVTFVDDSLVLDSEEESSINELFTKPRLKRDKE